MARMLRPFTLDAPPPMTFSLLPTYHLASEALHAAFVRAFADYLIGPFNLALDGSGWRTSAATGTHL